MRYKVKALNEELFGRVCETISSRTPPTVINGGLSYKLRYMIIEDPTKELLGDLRALGPGVMVFPYG